MTCSAFGGGGIDAHVGSGSDRFGEGLAPSCGKRRLAGQTLFRTGLPNPDSAINAVDSLHKSRILVEASPVAPALWQRLTKGDMP